MKKFKRVLIILTTVLFVFGLTSCNLSDYKEAEKLCEEGQWAAAAEIFTALGDYKDSALKASECNYRYADELYENGEYDKSKEIFLSLGDFEDSLTRVYDCNYQIAHAFYSDGDYESAVPLLVESENHEDSIKLLHQIMVDFANDYIEIAGKAITCLRNYEKVFTSEIYKQIFSGSGSFSIMVDVTDSNLVELRTHTQDITKLKNRYNLIFTDEVVEKLDDDMQDAHEAFTAVLDYSTKFFDVGGYSDWLIKTIASDTPKYSINTFISLLNDFESAIKSL